MFANDRRKTRKVYRMFAFLLMMSSTALLCLLFVLKALTVQATQGKAEAKANSTPPPPVESSCDPNYTGTVLAAYQAWHGLANHNLIQNAPYRSLDETAIAKSIATAQARCIDAFVVDWYGPEADWPNRNDRAYIDQSTAKLFNLAGTDLKIALMYDVGTLTAIPTPTLNLTDTYHTQVLSDLRAATAYFSQTNYLHIGGHPALFLFPYEAFERYLDWQAITAALGVSVTLLSKAEMFTTPNDQKQDLLECDPRFDGFYAWVRPTGGIWDGVDWGQGYMESFYAAMSSTCSQKLAIGGVWHRFDDRLAHWKVGNGRVIPANCVDTWNGLWQLAKQYKVPYVMLNTWNDFEEGTDVEFNVPNLLLTNNSPVLPGTPATLSAQMVDCQDVTYHWQLDHGPAATGSTIVYTYPKAGLYTATVTASNPTATVTATTQIVVSTQAWAENFDPIKPTWSEPSATWSYSTGATALLTENSAITDFGKVESEIIHVNVDDYPYLLIDVSEVPTETSYTIQLLDKNSQITPANTITAADILTGVTQSGYHFINFASLTGWHGVQTFTINLWISGEGKSVTFKRIDVLRPDVAYLPLLFNVPAGKFSARRSSK